MTEIRPKQDECFAIAFYYETISNGSKRKDVKGEGIALTKTVGTTPLSRDHLN